MLTLTAVNSLFLFCRSLLSTNSFGYCREKLDKEERKNKLTAGSNSRDSAIDNDLQDWDTDILDYEIVSIHLHYHSRSKLISASTITREVLSCASCTIFVLLKLKLYFGKCELAGYCRIIYWSFKVPARLVGRLSRRLCNPALSVFTLYTGTSIIVVMIILQQVSTIWHRYLYSGPGDIATGFNYLEYSFWTCNNNFWVLMGHLNK